MKIVENYIIPLPGFKAINLYGTLFVRYGTVLTETNINHEEIHTAQMRDWSKCMAIGGTIFYITYLFMWIWNLIFHTKTAYKSIKYEREAYFYQKDKNYLKTRKPFAWRRHQFSS